MRKYYRLHLLLDSKLYKNLVTNSISYGMSMSKLIQQWISKDNTGDKPREERSSRKKYDMSYNFRVKPDLYKTIIKKSRNFHSTSDYIRHLIIVKSDSISSIRTNNVHNLNDALRRYNFNKIKGIFLDEIDNLNKIDRFKLIEANIEIGNFEKTITTIDHIIEKEEYSREERNTLILNRAECNRNLIRFDKVLKDFSLIDKPDMMNSGYKDMIYGDINLLTEQFIKAENLYINALNKIDPNITPLNYFKTLIKLTWTYFVTGQKADYIRSKDQLVNLYNSNPNDYFKVLLYDLFAEISISENKTFEAKYYLDLSHNSNQLAGSIKESFYLKRALARMKLNQGSQTDAINLFSDAEKVEDYFRPELKFSRATLYKFMLLAKADYKKFYNQMVNLIDHSGKNLNETLNRYMLNTTKYVYSKEHLEREKGRKELIKIKEYGGYDLIRKSAESTLRNKVPIAIGYR